jgi:hypothetical protein
MNHLEIEESSMKNEIKVLEENLEADVYSLPQENVNLPKLFSKNPNRKDQGDHDRQNTNEDEFEEEEAGEDENDSNRGNEKDNENSEIIEI